MSKIIFPVLDREHSRRVALVGEMCSHCGHMPFEETFCPNGCPAGSLRGNRFAVIVVAAADIRTRLRDHVEPARIEQLERRMHGDDVPPGAAKTVGTYTNTGRK